MIYAKVDVKLRDHKLAHRAGAAMATWMWALLYVREHETDGHIPDDMIRLAWVGEPTARKHAARLVEVGLWAVVPDGWTICRYSDKNDTRETIDARRKETRDRVAKHRARNTTGNSVTNGVQYALVPGSGSGSGSGSEDLDLPRAIPPDPPSRPHNDSETPCAVPTAVIELPPPWWAAACDTVAASVAPVDDRGARWLEYAAARERKGWATGQRDAVGWLSTVVRSERRNAPTSARRGTGGGPKGDRQGLPPGPLAWLPTGTDPDFGGTE